MVLLNESYQFIAWLLEGNAFKLNNVLVGWTLTGVQFAVLWLAFNNYLFVRKPLCVLKKSHENIAGSLNHMEVKMRHHCVTCMKKYIGCMI